MGLVEVTGGAVRFDGRDITRTPTHEISRLGVGYVPEDRRIFSDLTVEENLRVGEKGGGGWTPRACTVLPEARRAGAAPARGQPLRRRAADAHGGAHAHGQSARRSCSTSPRRASRRSSCGRSAEQIAALKREGLTIVLSEQNLKFAARLADRAYIIEKGVIRFGGADGRALIADEVVAPRLSHRLRRSTV